MLDHLANHAWGHERSGAYCVANAENLSLAEVLSLLRKAMGKQQALFPLPTQLLNGPLILLGRRRLAQSRVDVSMPLDVHGCTSFGRQADESMGKRQQAACRCHGG